MSRQRLRTGMVEGSTRPCHVCEGTGVIRSTESVALLVLRAIEDWLISKGPANLAACTSVDAALYILNNKRVYLRDVEDRYGVTLTITSSETMHGSAYTIEKLAPASGRVIEAPKSVQMTWVHYDDDAVVEDEEEIEVKADAGAEAAPADSGEQQGEQRNRRRRKRFRNGHDRGEERLPHEAQPAGERPAGDEHVHAWRTRADVPQPDISEPGESLGSVQPGGEGTEDEARRSRRSRRRGRRGGQRQRELRSETGTVPEEMRQDAGEQPDAGMPEGAAPVAWQAETESRAEPLVMAMADAVSAVAELEPRREREESLPAPIAVEAPQAEMAVAIALPAEAGDVQALEAAKAQAEEAARAQEAANAEEAARRRAEQEQARAEARKARPSRGGWWQRRLGG